MPCGLAEEETRLMRRDLQVLQDPAVVLSTVLTSRTSFTPTSLHGESITKVVPHSDFGENRRRSPSVFQRKSLIWGQ